MSGGSDSGSRNYRLVQGARPAAFQVVLCAPPDPEIYGATTTPTLDRFYFFLLNCDPFERRCQLCKIVLYSSKAELDHVDISVGNPSVDFDLGRRSVARAAERRSRERQADLRRQRDVYELPSHQGQRLPFRSGPERSRCTQSGAAPNFDPRSRCGNRPRQPHLPGGFEEWDHYYRPASQRGHIQSAVDR